MSFLLFILGIVLLISVSLDVLVTTLTVQGGGFLTNRFLSWLWNITILIHKRYPNHRLLSSVGMLMLSGMVILWYLLTWIAWSLIFNSYEEAIINASNKVPTSTWGRIYFTAYTLTTLGRGDYQPTNPFWHLLTGLAGANGFFLVTLSIAYLFPVVSAVTQKRVLSVYITALGGTADKILANAWNGSNFSQLDQHLIALAPMVAELGEKHLAYPVLHYFHSNDRLRCLPLSIVALDEALTLLKYAVPHRDQPDIATLETLRRTNTAFLKTLKSVYLQPSSSNPPLFSLQLLRSQGIPTVKESDFLFNTKCINTRRQLLLAWLENDGWTWDAIASYQTTNRGEDLKDQTPMNVIKF